MTYFLVILIDNITCGDAVNGLCVGDQKAVTPDWPSGIDVLGDPEAVGAPHHDAAQRPLLLIFSVPVKEG